MRMRMRLPDPATARVLLVRELAIAMHRQLGRGATFTLTLEEMLEMPGCMVPIAGSGQEMMDSLGRDGIARAIVQKMAPKIKYYYEYDKWSEVLDHPVVYDEDHIVSLNEHITADELV
jgi:hypothetical protein